MYPRWVTIGAAALVNYRSSGVWITGIVNGVHKKGGVVNVHCKWSGYDGVHLRAR